MKTVDGKYSPSPCAERTAKILADRYGTGAFDFATRQLAIMRLTAAITSVDEWRAIAREIERQSRAPEGARALDHGAGTMALGAEGEPAESP